MVVNAQEKRAKMIKGLECCIIDVCDEPCNCPYYGDGGCIGSLMRDAIATLKAQEPENSNVAEPCSDTEYCWYDITHKYTPEQAFNALKAQEPMNAIVVHNDISGCGSWWYQCQRCKMAIDPKDKFCRSCGQAVKWV